MDMEKRRPQDKCYRGREPGFVKDEPESPSVVSRMKDYIGIAAGIASIIKLCKDILSP